MSRAEEPLDFETAAARYFSVDARTEYEWRRRLEAYLASEAWKSKRLQKLLSLVGITAYSYNSIDWLAQHASRYFYRCEKCGAAGNQSDVHVQHRHYRSLGKEPLYDLVVLCSFCHDALHKIVGATGLDVEVVTARLVGPQPPTQAR